MPESSWSVPVPGVAIRVAPRVQRVLAPNAGAWTFEGTNTWVIGDPAASTCAVVDPGPADSVHLTAVLDAVGSRKISEIFLTHGHNDHADGARELSNRTGAIVLAQRSIDDRTTVEDGQSWLLAAHVPARILATPGHTRDSLCVHLSDDAVVLTGDTVLGAGSPMVHPNLLAQMLTSLRRLADFGGMVGLPGHGPVIDDLGATATRRLAARARRIEQVAALRDSGTTAIGDLVAAMYRHIDDPDVLMAAHSSVQSMVVFLDSDHVVSSLPPAESDRSHGR